MINEIKKDVQAGVTGSATPQFRLRTLLAVTAGLAFGFSLFSLLLRNNADRWLLVLLPLWAIGSLIGMAISSRDRGRTLLGSLIGGCIPVVVVVGAFVWTNKQDMEIGFTTALGIFGVWIGISAGASSVLAVIVGVLREGISVSGK